ncbi:iron(III) transport system ATP-binding protein [Arthrobacter sp. CAN_A214]|uniref:ABC transporter ATP-binding protein n=1 Tax=Arthrobacter sp. CAN_A214 TaxID=2787720 RepID=UPI0018CAE313
MTTHPAGPAVNHLDLVGLTRSFGGVEVLKGLTLSVQAGITTAIVGPSGSGKTTLLRIIAGFDSPDSGTVSLQGNVVAGPGVLVPAHRRNIGYVAQDGALFPHLSVGENVAFGLDRRAYPRRSARARVGELLGMVSLAAAYADRRPDELSGGQQQRVALARALARGPSLMLLDEPFSALDTGLRVATRKAVAATLAETGVTTILVTHDQSEALSFSDQVAVLRGGVLAQVGNPFVVYTRPVDRQTAEFLGDAVILEADLQGSLAYCALGAIPVRRPTCQGTVQLMLRPEQIRITEDGSIAGTVLETDFFGPEVTVTIRLEGTGTAGTTGAAGTGGEIITIRHWNAAMARIGTRLRLSVVGEGVAFPGVANPSR